MTSEEKVKRVNPKAIISYYGSTSLSVSSV